MSGACSTHGRDEKCVHFGLKLEGTKPFEGPWRRWKDNIRMDVREVGWKGVDWMHLI
jgi:hypothetical protein